MGGDEHKRRLAVLAGLGFVVVAAGALLATRSGGPQDLRTVAMRCMQVAAEDPAGPRVDLNALAAEFDEDAGADTQVFRAWVAGADGPAREAITRALALQPDHLLALQAAAEQCGSADPPAFCADLLTALATHPRPTTGTWTTAAVLADRLGDRERAAAFIAEAARATPGGHVADRVNLAAGVLQAHAADAFAGEAHLVEAAFGTAMAVPAPQTEALALCDPDNGRYLGPENQPACLTLGERLARSGRSLEDQVAGLTIWEKQARAAGDEAALAEIQRLNTQRGDLQLRMIGLTCAGGENRLATLAYLEDLDRYGEIGAARRLIEQVEGAN